MRWASYCLSSTPRALTVPAILSVRAFGWVLERKACVYVVVAATLRKWLLNNESIQIMFITFVVYSFLVRSQRLGDHHEP